MQLLTETERDDVLRELTYCKANGFASRYGGGTVARAQDIALGRGWLEPDSQRPGCLVLTAAGRAVLATHRRAA